MSQAIQFGFAFITLATSFDILYDVSLLFIKQFNKTIHICCVPFGLIEYTCIYQNKVNIILIDHITINVDILAQSDSTTD